MESPPNQHEQSTATYTIDELVQIWKLKLANGTGPVMNGNSNIPMPTLADEEVGLGVIILAIIYGLLFLIGVTGNTSIFVLMARIKNRSGVSSGPRKTFDSGFVQILALSCVDVFIMLSIPLTMSDMILSYWLFGNFICKMYWLMESSGKIISTFILTFMSFDRYMQICHPAKTCFRRPQPTLLIILCLGGLAVGALSPLPYFAREYPISSSYLLSPSEATRMGLAIYKCMLDVDHLGAEESGGEVEGSVEVDGGGGGGAAFLRIFTWYIFALGFMLPFTLIAFFYTKILLKIREHQKKSLARSHVSLVRVVTHTLVIVLFYFTCWCPYWIGVLYSHLRRSEEKEPNAGFVYFMYGIHALPYLNSAFNWVFYAMLNQQLRRKKDNLSNRHGGTSNNTLRTGHQQLLVTTSNNGGAEGVTTMADMSTVFAFHEDAQSSCITTSTTTATTKHPFSPLAKHPISLSSNKETCFNNNSPHPLQQTTNGPISNHQEKLTLEPFVIGGNGGDLDGTAMGMKEKSEPSPQTPSDRSPLILMSETTIDGRSMPLFTHINDENRFEDEN